jgi:hypothetical protein
VFILYFLCWLVLKWLTLRHSIHILVQGYYNSYGKFLFLRLWFWRLVVLIYWAALCVESGNDNRKSFYREHEQKLGFEVFTAVVMKSTVFWDITPCSPLSVKRRFGGKYRLHLHGRRNVQHETSKQAPTRRYMPEVDTLHEQNRLSVLKCFENGIIHVGLMSFWTLSTV